MSNTNKAVQTEESCCLCQFFHPQATDQDGVTGECRKQPPVIMDSLINEKVGDMIQALKFASRWPVIWDDDSCGQFKERA